MREAKQYSTVLADIDPDFTLKSYVKHSPNSSFESGERIARNLEKAGLPYC